MAQHDETFQLAELAVQLRSPVPPCDSPHEGGQAAVAEIPVIGLVEMYLAQFHAAVRHAVDKVDVAAEQGDGDVRLDLMQAFVQFPLEKPLLDDIFRKPFVKRHSVQLVVVDVKLVKDDGRVQVIIWLPVFAFRHDDMYFVTEHFGKIIRFQCQHPFHAAGIVECRDTISYFHCSINILFVL